MFLDALGLGKISVGPPYFDTVFVPLMAPAVFLMARGPDGELEARRRCRTSGCACAGRWRVPVAAALILPFVDGQAARRSIAFGLWLAFWVVAATVAQVLQRLRASRRNPRCARKLAAQSRSWYGMTLAHLGIGDLHPRRDRW